MLNHGMSATMIYDGALRQAQLILNWSRGKHGYELHALLGTAR
jgi:hypothetical protein